MTLKLWVNSVLGHEFEDSPGVVNDYCQKVLEDEGFVGDSHDLSPIHNGWIKVQTPDLQPGDIAIIPKDHQMLPYGDSVVITSVTTVQVMGISARGNIEKRAGWTNYPFRRIEYGWRYLPKVMEKIKPARQEALSF